MNKHEVSEAFEILLEAIETVVNMVKEESARSLRVNNYERAKAAIEEASQLTEFLEKVKALRMEWTGLFMARPGTEKKRRSPRKVRAPLPRGLRTPEERFRRPILEALVELGGSAPMREVLDLVEPKMKGILNEYDYGSLSSSPRSIRWRNTAQWCRNMLVQEGLLKNNSPYGIWEISDQGRKWLTEHAKI
ncbi:MAG: winged helix-turn-helix domain-containing protein [Candidatus Helarchaeota archaeon]